MTENTLKQPDMNSPAFVDELSGKPEQIEMQAEEEKAEIEKSVNPEPSESYRDIHATLVKTESGRLFLKEHLNSARSEDMKRIFDAIERIEGALESREKQKAKQSLPQSFPTIEGRDMVKMGILEMASAIQRTRREITSIRAANEDDDHLHNATEELGAIVEATEQATNTILEAAEEIQEIGWHIREKGATDDFCDRLDTKVTDIYTACSFQDITGQRTTKVVDVLDYIEERVRSMIEIWGLSTHETDLLITDNQSTNEDAHLLNGPALGNSGLEQSDIDSMLKDEEHVEPTPHMTIEPSQETSQTELDQVEQTELSQIEQEDNFETEISPETDQASAEHITTETVGKAALEVVEPGLGEDVIAHEMEACEQTETTKETGDFITHSQSESHIEPAESGLDEEEMNQLAALASAMLDEGSTVTVSDIQKFEQNLSAVSKTLSDQLNQDRDQIEAVAGKNEILDQDESSAICAQENLDFGRDDDLVIVDTTEAQSQVPATETSGFSEDQSRSPSIAEDENSSQDLVEEAVSISEGEAVLTEPLETTKEDTREDLGLDEIAEQISEFHTQTVNANITAPDLTVLSRSEPAQDQADATTTSDIRPDGNQEHIIAIDDVNELEELSADTLTELQKESVLN